MFAVIKTGGKQYRVVPDDVLEVGKIEGQVGTIVQLNEVLVVGGDTPVLGVPTVAGASVAVEVLQHKRGYRDELTVLRVTEILTDNAKPTKGPRPKKEKVAKEAGKEAAQQAAE